MKIKVTVIVGIFFIILGTLFGIIGNKLEKSEKLKETRCSESVEAVIDGIEENSGESGITYRPIYKYHYKSKVYTIKSNVSMYPLPDGYQVGNTISIKINPDKPEEIYDSAMNIDMLYSVFALISKIFVGVGIITIIVSIITALKFIGKNAVGAMLVRQGVDDYNNQLDYTSQQYYEEQQQYYAEQQQNRYTNYNQGYNGNSNYNQGYNGNSNYNQGYNGNSNYTQDNNADYNQGYNNGNNRFYN